MLIELQKTLLHLLRGTPKLIVNPQDTRTKLVKLKLKKKETSSFKHLQATLQLDQIVNFNKRSAKVVQGTNLTRSN